MSQSEVTADLTLNRYKPIHLPGAIQPHGVLLALSDPELKILQLSDNTQTYFGIEAKDLLDRSLSVLLDPPDCDAIAQCLGEDLGSLNPLMLSIRTPAGKQCFDAIVHRTEGAILLELERSSHSASESTGLRTHTLLRKAIANLHKTTTLPELLQGVAEAVQTMTGFDRVLVYQFDDQGAGSVVAEVKQPRQSSYLGLRYPALDIPAESRELYRRGMLRFVPDVNAPFVPLVPLENPATQQPLDLSLAMLRSVDPCCVDYHRHMGVSAFLVISLLKDQQLWGLISCHHEASKALPYEIRTTCDLLGQFVSLELANRVDQEELGYFVKLRALQSEFGESISQVENLREALVNPAPRLLDLVNSQGAAVCLEDEITLVGATPPEAEVRALIEWADTHVNESLFYTNSLPKHYQEAEAFKQTASGLLLLRISKIRRYYILWFRPEVIQTVNWAGDPSESVTVQADGSILFSARASFERWQETVRLTALPWKSYELNNALDLRTAIVGMVLKKAEELAQINLELERSNRELDFFAYAASHDLKEPLRGIHNNSVILLEDYGETLDEEGRDCLETIGRLTQRMDVLIDVLLQFSQLGKAELHLQETNLNDLMSRLLDMFDASRQGTVLDIRIPRSLPTIECDPVLVSEVFSNLLSNAFKYNDKEEPWAEVGYFNAHEQNPPDLIENRLHFPLQHSLTSPIFYVRDNGIGMRSHHLDIIFKLFKRLYAQEEYGGGAGAGLTMTKKIVERHGGQIWVESVYGKGSTFYFTLR
jgi:chemotaxis family two-component system sensor kinase Cph1